MTSLGRRCSRAISQGRQNQVRPEMGRHTRVTISHLSTLRYNPHFQDEVIRSWVASLERSSQPWHYSAGFYQLVAQDSEWPF